MYGQYTPHTLPLLLIALVSIVVACLIWRGRRASGAISLFLLILATIVWSLTYVIELGGFALGICPSTDEQGSENTRNERDRYA